MSPRSPAKKPLVVKIPVPIMFDTTKAVALTTPSWRERLEVLEVDEGEVTCGYCNAIAAGEAVNCRSHCAV